MAGGPPAYDDGMKTLWRQVKEGIKRSDRINLGQRNGHALRDLTERPLAQIAELLDLLRILEEAQEGAGLALVAFSQLAERRDPVLRGRWHGTLLAYRSGAKHR